MNAKGLSSFTIFVVGCFAQSLTIVTASVSREASFVTIDQYCVFLNAVAATDTHHLYDEKMESDQAKACIFRSGVSGYYRYSVIKGRKCFPVSHVSWLGVIRYCNWFENGRGTSKEDPEITEYGVYDLENDHVFLADVEASYFVSSSEENMSLLASSMFSGDPFLTPSLVNYRMVNRPILFGIAAKSSGGADDDEGWKKILEGMAAISLLAEAKGNLRKEKETLDEEGNSSRQESNSLDNQSNNDMNSNISSAKPHSSPDRVSDLKTPEGTPEGTPRGVLGNKGVRLKSHEGEAKNLFPTQNRDFSITSQERPSDLISKLNEVNLDEGLSAKFSSPANRKVIFEKAQEQAVRITQYAADAIEAVNSVYDALDSIGEYKKTDLLSDARHDIEAAKTALEIAQEHLKNRSVSSYLQKTVTTSVGSESYNDDRSLLTAVDLAVTAVKEATEKAQSIAEELVNTTSNCSRDALVPIQKLSHEKPLLFGDATSITKSLSMNRSLFPDLPLVKETKEILHQAIQSAQTVMSYAGDLMKDVAEGALTFLDRCEGRTASQQSEELYQATTAAKAGIATIGVAVKNAQGHLEQLKESSQGEMTASSEEQDLSLLALKMTTFTLKQAIQNMRDLLPGGRHATEWNQHEETWPLDVSNIKKALEKFDNNHGTR